jgi:hypothetical protein
MAMFFGVAAMFPDAEPQVHITSTLLILKDLRLVILINFFCDFPECTTGLFLTYHSQPSSYPSLRGI